MDKKIYDVLIIGKLAGFDIIFAEYLSRKGLRCCVARNAAKGEMAEEKASNLYFAHTHFNDKDIVSYGNGLEFLALARKSRLIISFTGSLIGALKAFWFFRGLLGLPPVVNVTTGSDITELAVERSMPGLLYRQYLRFADLNWCVAYPQALKNIAKLNVPNVVFLRHPYYLIPQPGESAAGGEKRPLRFFHASHLDWKVSDPGSHRNSSKGNDRFLRAFARAVKAGLDAQCVILDRGPDRDLAKKLVKELGVDGRFIWKPRLTRKELMDEFKAADVVIDQFDIGGFGGIAIEAMSAGRAIMIYLDENCIRPLYAEMPPVLNCRDEDQIYEAIMRCADRKYVRDLGEHARRWAYTYHSGETCLDEFLGHYKALTSGKAVKA